MKFLGNSEEVISENFEIEADTLEEALEIVKRAYDDGDIVLENGELIAASMEVYDEENECWSKKIEI